MSKALTAAIEQVGLTGGEAEILRYLAREPLGIPEDGFGSILASRTHMTPSECTAAAVRLATRNFITLRKEEDGDARYFANMAALPLDCAALDGLARIARGDALLVLGAPHGERAMRTLSEVFLNERRPIFLALDITGHEVFKEKLEERARRGLRTTFMAPAKRAIPEHLRKHWEDIFYAWAQYLSGSSRELRRNVALLLTPKYYRHLSTSLATEDFVRFDVYWTDDDTTRNGEIVQASKSTSLYDLVRAQYEDAYATADPFWRADPGRWALAKLTRWVVPVAVVASLFAVTCWTANEKGSIEKVLFALGSNLVADVIGVLILKRVWWNRKKSIS